VHGGTDGGMAGCQGCRSIEWPARRFVFSEGRDVQMCPSIPLSPKKANQLVELAAASCGVKVAAKAYRNNVACAEVVDSRLEGRRPYMQAAQEWAGWTVGSLAALIHYTMPQHTLIWNAYRVCVRPKVPVCVQVDTALTCSMTCTRICRRPYRAVFAVSIDSSSASCRASYPTTLQSPLPPPCR
jgi:hypothetical protein